MSKKMVLVNNMLSGGDGPLDGIGWAREHPRGREAGIVLDMTVLEKGSYNF
ncbi:hypothetical protein J6590_063927 [Homalodisca vitripennis]|nr:hypothetical protein J6590_063927 [Homalodisca vitripennis]